MNFYTTAARIHKKVDQIVEQHRMAGTDTDEDTLRATLMTSEMATARRNMMLGVQLMSMYKEVCDELGVNPKGHHYFITIRPDDTKVTWPEFFAAMLRLVSRKCFLSYAMTFEQKGLTMDTLGAGFHTHIVARCTQRSKGEVLRDLFSSVKHFTAYQCVDVAVCKNPDVHIQRYMIDYESTDGHKMITKEWDSLWREKHEIDPIYRGGLNQVH